MRRRIRRVFTLLDAMGISRWIIFLFPLAWACALVGLFIEFQRNPFRLHWSWERPWWMRRAKHHSEASPCV